MCTSHNEKTQTGTSGLGLDSAAERRNLGAVARDTGGLAGPEKVLPAQRPLTGHRRCRLYPARGSSVVCCALPLSAVNPNPWRLTT